MAFDAKWEDFQRLALRFAKSLDDDEPLAAARSYANFGHRYAQDRDSLPQTDADRAFHLVAEAAVLIDYQLPFASDEQAESIMSQAHRYLDEALSLDETCYDALRMKAAATCPSFQDYLEFLQARRDEVYASCLDAASRVLAETGGAKDERSRLAEHLALSPYFRWLAMMASKALICGRNREVLYICDDLLDFDPSDTADARLTAALALAKLEDDEGLDELEDRYEQLEQSYPKNDAWMLLSRLALAHRRRDLTQARQIVSTIIDLYPQAVVTLARQLELPDGVYSRITVSPFSEDELILALSEATVLTQEGRDSFGCGALGSWLREECLSRATKEDLLELGNLADRPSKPGRQPLGGQS